MGGGQVHGPDGQTGVVLGGVADVEYTSAPLIFPKLSMTVKCQSHSGGGRIIASAADEGSTSPPRSLDRGNMSGAEASIEGHPSQSGEAVRTPTMEDMISPEDGIAQPTFIKLPTPSREGQAQTSRSERSETTAKVGSWRGEVFGRMHEAPHALLEVLNTLKAVKKKVRRGMSEEENEDDVTSSEEEDDEEDRDRGGVATEPSTGINLRSRHVKKEQELRRPMFKSSNGKVETE